MKNQGVKQDYIWNMIGSICYSASSFYYLMMVTRICGVMEGGVFSLAFATAQLLLTFGRYGMRTYQATDVQRQYSFAEYGVTRILTCAGMVLFAGVYSLIMGYSMGKLQIFVWVAALKMLDAVEDVFHGELQRNYRVALMGKLLAARNVFSCVVFGVVLVTTGELLPACGITVLLSFVFSVTANGMAVWKTCGAGNAPEAGGISGQGKNLRLGSLFVICFPIFVSTFLSLYLYNIPKYAIDAYLTEDIQTYYSVMFMPSFLISLFSEIITRPMMTTISISWEKDLPRFISAMKRIYLLIAGGTVLMVLGGHLIGRRLLELVYAVSLEDYKLELVVLLLGGGISSAVYVSYNILIAIRFQKIIIAVYVAVALAATPATYAIVSRMGMLGAAVSYLLTCLLLEIVFGSVLLIKIRGAKRRGAEHG